LTPEPLSCSMQSIYREISTDNFNHIQYTVGLRPCFLTITMLSADNCRGYVFRAC